MPCSHCGKETALERALLTQDLNTNTLVFCSPQCRDGWFEDEFLPLAKRAANQG
jgi:hypothetical protein